MTDAIEGLLNGPRHYRRVKRARLTLADRDDAHAAQFALEDALNTADFGDAGRLIVIRSLAIGGLRARTPSHELARRLEAAWRVAAAHAVSVHDTSAAAANAVWFASSFAARAEWLTRVARDALVDDWYWPSAVPGASGHPSPRTVAIVLLTTLAEAPHALVEELQSWSASLVMRLVARLPDDPPTATASTGVAQSTRPPQTASHADTKRTASPTVAPSVAKRDAWLRALGVPPAAPIAAQNMARQQPPAHLPAAAPRSDHFLPTTLQRMPPPAYSLRLVSLIGPRAYAPDTKDRVHPLPATLNIRDAQPLPVHSRPDHYEDWQPWPWWSDLRPTACGGFLMLVNVLDVLGFAQWLRDREHERRRALVSRLFLRLCDAARVPEDDPHRLLFADVEHRPDEMEARTLLRWVVAVRRVLRRGAGLTLCQLVHRDAQIAISRTHVDVVFALDTVDLQLRRRGLDSDPGWVTWIARIVAFHFVDNDDPAYA